MTKSVYDFFKAKADTDSMLDFQMADEMPEKVPVISTGSIALDDALGCGGYPFGRIIQIYGPSGQGKTIMAMIAIKNAQLLDPTAQQVWADAEQTFNPHWAKTLGIDISRLFLIKGETASIGRKCFEALLGEPKEDARTHEYVGKKTNGLFDEIAEGSLNVNLVVLDSLGAVIPPQEDVAAVGKANMAALARFLSKEFKRFSLDVSRAKIPFIVINHKKDNMDPYASSNHGFSGGNSYSHFLSVNIYVEAIGRKDAQILDDKDRKIGHTIRATTEKSKFGPWPRRCEFKLDFNQGIIDVHEELINVALDNNIIMKPTSMSYEFEGEKWVGMPKLTEAVKENHELQEKLRSAIQKMWDARYEPAQNKSQTDVEEPALKKSRKKKNEDE